jgi:hypothetical protein
MSTLQESIEVYVGEDGNVCIAHVDMSEECFVAISPEHVDQLISWLHEKRAARSRLSAAGHGDKAAPAEAR